MRDHQHSKSTGKSRRRPFVLDEHEPDLGPKVQTRLFSDDDEYLRGKLTSTGKTEADLIRRWVRRGIKAERLERAARDPVVNSLLRALDDVLGAHTARLERRLSMEFHTLRRLTATTIVLANAAMRILEAYVASQPPPDEAALAGRRKSFFGALYRRYIKEAEGIMDGMLDERDGVLDLLVEQELLTGLRDRDLSEAIDKLKALAEEDAEGTKG